MNNLKQIIKSHQAFFLTSVVFSALIIIYNNQYTYYFKYMITPIEVFLHEASHGIAALISRFEIAELKMEWHSGHVKSIQSQTAYFRSAFVSFAGYAGTTMFGFVLFLASIKNRRVYMSLMVIVAMFFTCYFSDVKTIIVMAYVIAFFALCSLNHKSIDYVLRFFGAYIMTTSVVSPTYQLHTHDHSDSMSLQKLLPLPEVFWVGLWMCFSIIVIYLSFKTLRSIDKKNWEKQSLESS